MDNNINQHSLGKISAEQMFKKIIIASIAFVPHPSPPPLQMGKVFEQTKLCLMVNQVFSSCQSPSATPLTETHSGGGKSYFGERERP